MQIDGYEVKFRKDRVFVGCVEVSKAEVDEIVEGMKNACDDETFHEVTSYDSIATVDMQSIEEGDFAGYGLHIPHDFVIVVDEDGIPVLTTVKIAQSMGYDC